MGEVYNMYTTTGGKLRWFDTETGEHTYDPNKPTLTEPIDSYSTSKTINPPTISGWICPVCGRGLSPYTSVCPCKGYPKIEITC